jgi:hypothetical protein
MAKLIGAAGLVVLGVVLLAGAFVGDAGEQPEVSATVVTTDRISESGGSCCDDEAESAKTAASGGSCCDDEAESAKTAATSGSCCEGPKKPAVVEGCCAEEPEPSKVAEIAGD